VLAGTNRRPNSPTMVAAAVADFRPLGAFCKVVLLSDRRSSARDVENSGQV
jgi:hypothetical protein